MDKLIEQPVLDRLFMPCQAGHPLWKRPLDIVCCLLVLPFVSPLLGLVALWMRFTAKGPLLYRQERVGYRGQTFCCFKLRTMKVNADPALHQAYVQSLLGTNAPMLKMDGRGDPRLIPGGWLLRASGLDELPQIINILRGEMSVVGPRPCLPYEYDKYLPWQKYRFAAVPGLTGLWQVSGKNHTTFDQMVRLDIFYAETRSLWLDGKILFLTAPAVLRQIWEARRDHGRPRSVTPTPAEQAPVPIGIFTSSIEQTHQRVS
jgi:lipopolysaccharide/colanic/teichoic acid biosynthesis glycosyltransferase